MVLTREEFAGPKAVTIRGWSTSNDANHLTGPSRDGSGLAQAIRGALGMAGLQPAEIDYITAHGTGTPYNDAMESLAFAASRGVFTSLSRADFLAMRRALRNGLFRSVSLSPKVSLAGVATVADIRTN